MTKEEAITSGFSLYAPQSFLRPINLSLCMENHFPPCEARGNSEQSYRLPLLTHLHTNTHSGSKSFRFH